MPTILADTRELPHLTEVRELVGSARDRPGVELFDIGCRRVLAPAGSLALVPPRSLCQTAAAGRAHDGYGRVDAGYGAVYPARLRQKGGTVRKCLFAVMTACVALASPSGLAWAETTSSQVFVVYAVGAPGTPRTVVAAGAINGVGTVVIGESQPGPGGSLIQQTTWVFPEGSLFVTLTYTFTSSIDQQSCSSTSFLTGTWQITGGTGRYTGATGSGTISGPNTTYFTRTAGGCTSTPFLVATRFVYRGTVTLAQPAAA